jgi:hypothetical protein
MEQLDRQIELVALFIIRSEVEMDHFFYLFTVSKWQNEPSSLLNGAFE